MFGLNIVHASAAGKTPGSIDDDPHIKAAAGTTRDTLDIPILDDNALGGTFHDAHIYVARAELLGDIQRPVR
jgi:hypothetical protein